MLGPTNDKEIPKLIMTLVNKLYARALDALKKHSEVEPALYFFNADPKQEDGIGPHVGILPVGPLMNGPAGKSFVEYVMEDTVKQDKVDVVILVSEAWVAKVSQEEVEKGNIVRASERPDKQETVLFNVMTKTKQFLGNAKIVRDPLGLEPLEIFLMDPSDSSQGTLVRKEGPRLH